MSKTKTFIHNYGGTVGWIGNYTSGPNAAYFDGPTDVLHPIPRGDNWANFSGRGYVLTNLLLRYVISCKASKVLDPYSDEIVRIAVVLDTQTNSAKPTLQTIYAMNFAGGWGGEINVMRHPEHLSRFHVLYEDTHNIHYRYTDAADVHGGSWVQRVDIPMNIPVISHNTGSTGNVSDLPCNSLHIYCWSKLAKEHAQTMGTIFSYTAQFKYHDMTQSG